VIPRRHTNRRPFTDVAIPPGVLKELREAAHAEDATLAVADDAHRDAVLGLVRAAEHRWFSRPDYWTEFGRMDAGHRGPNRRCPARGVRAVERRRGRTAAGLRPGPDGTAAAGDAQSPRRALDEMVVSSFATADRR
jgi:hypothetical protein